jgi:hypothetical protein
MRRCLLVLVVVCVFATLVFLPSASAAGWTVKNHSGARLGKVVRTVNGWCLVYDRAGRQCGDVTWTTNSGTRAYSAARRRPGDLGASREAAILKSGGHPYAWFMDNLDSSGTDGFVLKKNRRWLVYVGTMVNPDALRARVALGCPGWAAAGAVFALSKSFQ